MISRRRFIAITASMFAVSNVSAFAKATGKANWQGRAFGADVSIELIGEQAGAEQALEAARDTVMRLERLFSLYDPASALSKLNRAGRLKMPPEFSRLMEICENTHGLTNGLFDPTIQPLFEAYRKSNGKLSAAKLAEVMARIGWKHVHVDGQDLSFDKPDMAMTVNGIAQGFASDRVADVLAAHGFSDAVVNIGEYHVGDTPFPIDVQNLLGKRIGNVELKNASIATTSRHGYRFSNGRGHILSPSGSTGSNKWNTVSVVAKSAALADGLSTALALTSDLKLAGQLYETGAISKFIAEDIDGKVFEIG